MADNGIRTINAPLRTLSEVLGHDTTGTFSRMSVGDLTNLLIGLGGGDPSVVADLAADLAAVAANLDSANTRLSNNVTTLELRKADQSFVEAMNVRLSQDVTNAQGLIAQLFGTPVAVDDRPGDTPRNFTQEGASGEPADLDPLPASAVVVSDAGREYLARGARFVATRKATAAEAGRAFRARWLYRRRANPADPAGHAVVCKFVCLDARKQQIGEIIVSTRVPLVTDGPILATATISSQLSQTVEYAWPPGTVYLRAVCQTYGEDGLVGLQVMSIADVTDATLLDPISSDIAARVAALEGLPDLVDALEQAVGQPKRLTFSTLQQAKDANPPLNVEMLTILGESAPGDGRGGDFSRIGTALAGRLSFSTKDGQLWQEVRLSPQFLAGQLQAKMQRGDTVRIACFGDSQTDGNSTTGWTANATSGTDPQGGVIPTGNANHTDEAPKAWPAQMRTILRDMYRNSAIQVWNAGYSGMQMNNGWALRQYDRAVTNNPAYGTPDAVTVMFGANDIQTAGNVVSEAQWVQTHIDQTRAFCRMLLSRGILPILMIGIPIFTTSESGGTRDHVRLSRQINTAKETLAKAEGIPLISLDTVVSRWFASNDDTFRWQAVQGDGVHGGDGLHAFIAGYIAAQLFRDTVVIGTRPERVLNYDPRSEYHGGPEFGWVDFGTFPRQGAAPILSNSTSPARTGYTAGQEVTRIWVWNETPDASCIYRHSANEGISDRSKSPTLTLLDVVAGSTIYSGPPANTGFPQPTIQATDRPTVLGQLAYGLNKVSLAAPQATDQIFRYGWFEFVPRYLAGRQSQAYRNVRSEASALLRAGSWFDVANPALNGQQLLLEDEAPDGSNVMSFGLAGRTAALLLDAQIDPGRGLCLLMGRGYGSDGVARLRTGLLLYRTGSNSLRLYNFAAKLVSGGALQFDFDTLADGAAGSYAFTGYQRLLVTCSRDGSNNQVVTVGTSWAGGSNIVTYTAAAGSGKTVPWGGYVGDLFANSGDFGSGGRVIDVRTAKIIHT